MPMKTKIVLTMVYLMLLTLVLSLSHWQWRRAEQKRAWLQQQEQAVNAEAIQLSADSPDDAERLRYRKVRVIGYYDSAHQFLLDNQVSSGKAGYFVLTPLRLSGTDKAVLVNRGWLPWQHGRTVLQDLSVSSTAATLNGRINKFPSVGVKLTGAEIPANGWPSLVQVVDTEILANKLGYRLFPFQLELNEQEPGGFKRSWQTAAVMQPEQHIAYAVQWLALALTLTALFVWYGFIHKHD